VICGSSVGSSSAPSGPWVVNGPNEQQCAAALILNRTKKRPIDDHLERLLRARDGSGPDPGRCSGRGLGAFLVHLPIS
jgi:hypothetical protein